MKNLSSLNLGQNDYLNLMKYCEFICGNSSSGIIEAPSLKVKTLNIGDRQKGRELSNQTLSVNNEYSEIKKGIKKLDNMKLKKIINPYDGGETSKNIFEIVDNLKNKNLLKLNMNKILNKKLYIIAEAGVNHNGDIKLAKKLIRSAKVSGADAIKFQIFEASSLATVNSKKAEYQIKNTKKNSSQLDMLRKLELKKKNYFI